MTENTIPETNGAQPRAGKRPLDVLLAALHRLDHMLVRAVAAAEAAYGTKAATDPYRGLYITRDDADRLLVREPGAPVLLAPSQDAANTVPDFPHLAWLQRTFGLSPFDLDVILIALAPEVDLRYERLYAYLQDDVSRRRPSVDLVLNLLCSTVEAKFQGRTRFAPDAPLMRGRLLHLLPDGGMSRSTLLAQYVQLDDSLVPLLMGQSYLDPRIAPRAHLSHPEAGLNEAPLPDSTRKALAALIAEAQAAARPVHFYFQGQHGVGQQRIAAAVATEIGAPLLSAELGLLTAPGTDFATLVRLLFRQAHLQRAVLYLAELDGLRGDERVVQFRELIEQVAEYPGFVILAGERPWTTVRFPGGSAPLKVVTLRLNAPDFAGRRQCWEESLGAAGHKIPDAELDALASRFRLTPEQIAGAVASAKSQARLQALATDSSDYPTMEDLFAAACSQSTHDLGALARKIEPNYHWDDIVLPDDQRRHLREICNQARYRHVVYGQWGFDRKLSLGKGLNVLFSGPPGTGKTMAAEVIAAELHLELFKIDLSQIVSKYIGETEKNLSRIFHEARLSNAILFFDEADALFGKRSEVRDAHDRYANIEIAYLLQKMEEYEGISILATNLRQNLDEAFTRRLSFTVEFPFPDEASRLLIWQSIWPKETPLDEDLDLKFVARQFKLSGGSIKNVALAAAFLAAEAHSKVTMAHVLRALRREFQKMGKTVAKAEFGAYAEHLEFEAAAAA
jgi:AAA+ superfamily predicted ATPase